MSSRVFGPGVGLVLQRASQGMAVCSEAQQRYVSYRAMLVAIVSQSSFVLVFMGFPENIFGLFFTLRAIFILQGCLRDPPKYPLKQALRVALWLS